VRIITTNGPTDRSTNGPTDRSTNHPGHCLRQCWVRVWVVASNQLRCNAAGGPHCSPSPWHCRRSIARSNEGSLSVRLNLTISQPSCVATRTATVHHQTRTDASNIVSGPASTNLQKRRRETRVCRTAHSKHKDRPTDWGCC
jgi:hypothetical protein